MFFDLYMLKDIDKYPWSSGWLTFLPGDELVMNVKLTLNSKFQNIEQVLY